VAALAADARVPGSPGVVESVVERVVRLGFEVRVELRADSGERFAAQVTRAEAERARFEPGETVFARAVRPVDATDAEPALAI
jgi:sulfate transport system ATP-binding protein